MNWEDDAGDNGSDFLKGSEKPSKDVATKPSKPGKPSAGGSTAKKGGMFAASADEDEDMFGEFNLDLGLDDLDVAAELPPRCAKPGQQRRTTSKTGSISGGWNTSILKDTAQQDSLQPDAEDDAQGPERQLPNNTKTQQPPTTVTGNTTEEQAGDPQQEQKQQLQEQTEEAQLHTDTGTLEATAAGTPAEDGDQGSCEGVSAQQLSTEAMLPVDARGPTDGCHPQSLPPRSPLPPQPPRSPRGSSPPTSEKAPASEQTPATAPPPAPVVGAAALPPPPAAAVPPPVEVPLPNGPGEVLSETCPPGDNLPLQPIAQGASAPVQAEAPIKPSAPSAPEAASPVTVLGPVSTAAPAGQGEAELLPAVSPQAKSAEQLQEDAAACRQAEKAANPTEMPDTDAAAAAPVPNPAGATAPPATTPVYDPPAEQPGELQTLDSPAKAESTQPVANESAVPNPETADVLAAAPANNEASCGTKATAAAATAPAAAAAEVTPPALVSPAAADAQALPFTAVATSAAHSLMRPSPATPANVGEAQAATTSTGASAAIHANSLAGTLNSGHKPQAPEAVQQPTPEKASHCVYMAVKGTPEQAVTGAASNTSVPTLAASTAQQARPEAASIAPAAGAVSNPDSKGSASSSGGTGVSALRPAVASVAKPPAATGLTRGFSGFSSSFKSSSHFNTQQMRPAGAVSSGRPLQPPPAAAATAADGLGAARGNNIQGIKGGTAAAKQSGPAVGALSSTSKPHSSFLARQNTSMAPSKHPVHPSPAGTGAAAAAVPPAVCESGPADASRSAAEGHGGGAAAVAVNLCRQGATVSAAAPAKAMLLVPAAATAPQDGQLQSMQTANAGDKGPGGLAPASGGADSRPRFIAGGAGGSGEGASNSSSHLKRPGSDLEPAITKHYKPEAAAAVAAGLASGDAAMRKPLVEDGGGNVKHGSSKAAATQLQAAPVCAPGGSSSRSSSRADDRGQFIGQDVKHTGSRTAAAAAAAGCVASPAGRPSGAISLQDHQLDVPAAHPPSSSTNSPAVAAPVTRTASSSADKASSTLSHGAGLGLHAVSLGSSSPLGPPATKALQDPLNRLEELRIASMSLMEKLGDLRVKVAVQGSRTVRLHNPMLEARIKQLGNRVIGMTAAVAGKDKA